MEMGGGEVSVVDWPHTIPSSAFQVDRRQYKTDNKEEEEDDDDDSFIRGTSFHRFNNSAAELRCDCHAPGRFTAWLGVALRRQIATRDTGGSNLCDLRSLSLPTRADSKVSAIRCFLCVCSSR